MESAQAGGAHNKKPKTVFLESNDGDDQGGDEAD
jgi:hypothetical protein